MKSLQRTKAATVRSVFTSQRARRRTVGWLLVAAAALFGGTALVRWYVPWLVEPATLRASLEQFGPFAPAAFVLLQATQVVVAPIPGQVLGFVSGYLFGTVPGTAYSLLGAAIGSYVVFRLSRRFGRPYVERSIDPGLIAQFDAMTDRRGLLALFLVFLVPGLPDDVICFLAGLTDLRLRDMVAVSVLGRVPGYLVVNAAGAQLAADRLLETALLVGALVVLSIVGYAWREPLLRRLAGTERLSSDDPRL